MPIPNLMCLIVCACVSAPQSAPVATPVPAPAPEYSSLLVKLCVRLLNLTQLSEAIVDASRVGNGIYVAVSLSVSGSDTYGSDQERSWHNYTVAESEDSVTFPNNEWLCFDLNTENIAIGKSVWNEGEMWRLQFSIYGDGGTAALAYSSQWEVPIEYTVMPDLGLYPTNGDIGSAGYLTFDVFWKAYADRIRVSNRNWLTRRGCLDWWQLCLLEIGMRCCTLRTFDIVFFMTCLWASNLFVCIYVLMWFWLFVYSFRIVCDSGRGNDLSKFKD